MTSEGLGEMFEGDSADMCAEKFPLVSMGGRAEGLACPYPGARTPISASGIVLVKDMFFALNARNSNRFICCFSILCLLNRVSIYVLMKQCFISISPYNLCNKIIIGAYI